MTNTIQINLKEHFYDKTTLDRDFAKKSDIPTLSNLGGVVNVVKQQEAEAGYASTYYVTQDGTQVGSKINIPKDFLVRSASIKTVTTANEPQQGFEVDDKYLDFVINVADDSADNTHIYVNVRDLFNEYQAGTGLTLSNNTFSIASGIIPTDVSNLTDAKDTEFTPKSHEHGNITNDGKLSSPSQIVITGSDSKITTVSALDCAYVRDMMASGYDNISSSLTSVSKQRDINDAINTKIGDINTAIDTINNAGYITASEADLDNYYTKTQVDEMNCGTFTELQSLITPADPNDTIILNKDYKYNASTDSSLAEGIVIDKNLTIIGNGHILDGNENTRIFILDGGTSSTNIIVNITELNFINGYVMNHDGNDDGGAIYAPRYNIINISNCNFYNNGTSHGGAIHCNSLSTIINCNFYHNMANMGGAIYCVSSDTSITIANCIFKENSAETDRDNNILGTDIYANTSSTMTIYNCDTSNDKLYSSKNNGIINKPYLTDHQDISNKLEFSDLDDMIGLSYDNSTGILSLTFTDPNNNS